MKKTLTTILAISAISFIAYKNITVFVTPPMGVITKGKTEIMLRQQNTNFIDSTDALCERINGSVNLLCRGIMAVKVAEKAEVLIELPFSNFLYLKSTNGKDYL